jgi:predicted Zn-dependent protease with MMP-like domain
MGRVRLTQNEFFRVARLAVQELPPLFRPYLENVVVDVLDQPSQADLDHVEADRDELLGLFEGVALLDQSSGFSHPNRVKLFRKNLEAASQDREDLVRQIQETVVHEIAHHFGMTEEDLEPFEQAMEHRRRERFGSPPDA